ncbi:MAG TPA: DUF1259 domain-containing protein [Solirubrobacteraceae bacterium]|jgi:hypothetical protein|nr:DUF1259 domain-containing protein [Solirubrobacteraceae bacterium]
MSAGSRISRRRLFAASGGLAASGVFSAAPLAAITRRAPLAEGGALPVAQMLAVLEAGGTVIDGVLRVEIARDDIGDVAGPAGVTFTPEFQIHGSLAFQPLRNGLALLNGYHPVLATETNAFIDGVRDSGLTVQGFAQHYTELEPQVWFVHLRGYGGPEGLARAIRNAFGATATPFPQTAPSTQPGPIDPALLAKILHGRAQITSGRVVRVGVARRDRIALAGIALSPAANVSTSVEFHPIGSSGGAAWAAPAFSLTGAEAFLVVKKMRSQNWFVNSLCSHQTDEQPPLYFSHMLKSGNPYELAREIRLGLELTNSA